MKSCLSCNAQADIPATAPCATCGATVVLRDGVAIYAPEYTDESDGFKAEYFDELVKLEDRNFWFRARNRLLIWAFGRFMPKGGSFLEIGCGNGFVLRGLRTAYPEARFSGSEIFLNGLQFARQRLPGVDLMQMDGRHIPFAAHFDGIGAFDVLEHIDQDEEVLAQIHAALKPGGHLFLTVPQHMWLWSAMDDLACHVRRYTAAELNSKLAAAGFDVQRSTSFVFFLLPAMLAARLVKRNVAPEDVDTSTELDLHPVLNAVFYVIMRLEILLIRLGVSWPLGGSRLMVATKRKPTV
ncbi:class I SAM-dependent methyltransferase [uncultured Roseobacter sp.]|uniref:class I SAM-dependent methyltransferase n=1 Tax=uncultured Roseobacter sp. TaxID=114847 RepID=UPI00261387FB|nr:class I SAM-dependent methyltransferase [uncultured Roseobacter sp.]